MNNLLSIRTNVLYAKKKNNESQDEFIKHYEIIFLVEKPKYSLTNTKEVVKENGVEDLRLIVSEKDIPELINFLLELKNNKED
jgi:hypothetical protein